MLYLWLIYFYLWQNWCTIIAHIESQVLPPDKSLFFIIDTWSSGHHLYSTHINSVWPSDAIWLHCSGSTLAQVMAWCLTAPSHYLNQCWLIIKVFPRQSPESNFTRRADELILLHICVKKRDIPWGSFLHYQLSHYSDITWTSFHLNSRATELIVQQLVQANKKKIKALHYWPFAREIHWWPMDSPHNGPVIWKLFWCHAAVMVGRMDQTRSLNSTYTAQRSSDAMLRHFPCGQLENNFWHTGAWVRK